MPASRFFRPALLGAVLLLPALLAGCGGNMFDRTPDDDFSLFEDRPFTEGATKLPAMPADADLVPFYVSPTTTMKFAVDTRSLSVGDDNVVRYTVVITSPSGARNVSHEGLRCSPRLRKRYAVLTEGRWSVSSGADWESIQGYGSANAYPAALAQDAFCDGPAPLRKPEAIVKRLRTSFTPPISY